MRIIIAGGRDYNPDFEEFCNIVLRIIRKYKELGYNTSRDSLEIISGTANGADKMGEKFAEKYKIKLRLFPADWNDVTTPPVFIKYNSFGSYNAMAGNVRNEKMAQYATENDIAVLIAFAVNASPETKNMISIAKRYGMKIFLYEFTNKSGILTRKVSKKKKVSI